MEKNENERTPEHGLEWPERAAAQAIAEALRHQTGKREASRESAQTARRRPRGPP